ncbi:hypothetical protein H072_468 [Dactylellina haptotyla CBS 200.50]|uniref:tyrosinase n=1 Tax=Dactylellina haptotyla (strain CBS 200.50) TaxID=1284197 RepID=S8ARG7_DACHA|nr:hypothetical protein H072_468 [Dactylellina haptotyla CBS 200.50]
MAAKAPVILILGAGANIGSNVAKVFSSKGYKVALVSRTSKESENTAEQVNIQGDFSDPSSVADAFAKVKSLLGTPSVVVYNAASLTRSQPAAPLAISVADFTRDLNINTVSPFVAAQHAAQGFEELPESASKTFIFTGNILNTAVMPALFDLGVGKSATSHIVQMAATAYKDKGFKFYYTDERTEAGAPAAFGTPSGEAHAKHYLELSEGKTQGPWQQTFVKGIGITQSRALPVANSISHSNQRLNNRQLIQPIIVTGVKDGVSQENIPVRKEIRTIIENHAEFELLLLALQKFYAEPQTSETSYYGIASIHGRPFKAWNEVQQGKGSPQVGYCTHSDMLFLPWHRPYLALYEQFVCKHAADVVASFSDSDPRKPAFTDALQGLRIPYWDWAMDASLPYEVVGLKRIAVADPKVPNGKQMIDNPMYTYKFQGQNTDFPDAPYNEMRQTYRYPRQVNGSYESQPDPLNQALRAEGGNLKTRIYRLLTAYKDFELVGTSSSPRDNNEFLESFEGVHDTIHGITGTSGGQMNFLSYSAFEPVFWLHHANIDRLFAMWQGINPKAYRFRAESKSGTFAIPPNTIEDLNTNLFPFRQSVNTFFTSASVAKTGTFGYAYPETRDLETGKRNDGGGIMTAVNKLYGTQTPQGSLKAAGHTSGRKRTMQKKGLKSGKLNTTPSPEALGPFQKHIVDQVTDIYNEWTVNIKVNRAALGESFSIQVFLGDPSSIDPEAWNTDDNLVGSHAIFTDPGSKNGHIVSGAVPLTSALLNKIVDNELACLTPELVMPYLLKNLKIKVLAVGSGTRRVVKLEDVQDLMIQINTAEVTLPKSESEAPEWGKFHTRLDWIDVGCGKLTPTQRVD